MTPEALLIAERKVLNARLLEIEAELQALCKHVWQWHQIAGEGQVCRVCGKHNYEVDD